MPFSPSVKGACTQKKNTICASASVIIAKDMPARRIDRYPMTKPNSAPVPPPTTRTASAESMW